MKLNPAHIEEVLELINQGPYFQLLNIDIQTLEEGRCHIEANIERKHMNCFGGMHGGVYESIMDTAAYWALYAEMPEEAGFITLDQNANLTRAVQEGTKVRCEGTVVKRGGSICICEAKMFDEKDRLLGTSTSKIFVAPSLQPISAAIDALDPSRKLPPKFIDE
jgi:uncharacterized protein (TIGR00369 family)